MRFPLIIGAAALVALGISQAAPSASTYAAAPTVACMRRAHAEIQLGQKADVTLDVSYFPQLRGQFFWHVGRAASFRGVIVAFTTNRSSATRLAARLRRSHYSMGMTRAQAHRAVGQKGNVIWELESFTGLSTTQEALLMHCLR